MFKSFSYRDFASAIEEVSEGVIQPVRVTASEEVLRNLLKAHTLISTIELRETYGLPAPETVRELVKLLEDGGEVTIWEVGNGWGDLRQ